MQPTNNNYTFNNYTLNSPSNNSQSNQPLFPAAVFRPGHLATPPQADANVLASPFMNQVEQINQFSHGILPSTQVNSPANRFPAVIRAPAQPFPVTQPTFPQHAQSPVGHQYHHISADQLKNQKPLFPAAHDRK